MTSRRKNRWVRPVLIALVGIVFVVPVAWFSVVHDASSPAQPPAQPAASASASASPKQIKLESSAEHNAAIDNGQARMLSVADLEAAGFTANGDSLVLSQWLAQAGVVIDDKSQELHVRGIDQLKGYAPAGRQTPSLRAWADADWLRALSWTETLQGRELKFTCLNPYYPDSLQGAALAEELRNFAKLARLSAYTNLGQGEYGFVKLGEPGGPMGDMQAFCIALAR